LHVDRELVHSESEITLTKSQRILNSTLLFFILLMMLLIVLAGIIFLSYLIKSAAGIDFFSDAHLISSLGVWFEW